jgi:nicotinamidase-related amidase
MTSLRPLSKMLPLPKIKNPLSNIKNFDNFDVANSTKKFKVLVVVDVQNCFIQGGSLGGDKDAIENLYKYIKLVTDIVNVINSNNYDLVVFSKDYHPLNHSSLYDDIDPVHGVYTYHCRNIKKNCKKEDNNNTTVLYYPKDVVDVTNDINGIPTYTLKQNIDIEKTINIYEKRYRKKLYNTKKDSIADLLQKMKDRLNEEFSTLESNTNFIENILLINRSKNNDDEYYNLLNEFYNTNKDKNLDKINHLIYIINFLELIEDKNITLDGIGLNYLFYATNLKDIIERLNDIENNNFHIKLNDQIDISEKPTNNNQDNYNLNINHIEYTTNNNHKTNIIGLLKGEYCDYESYSAFNYHLQIKKGEKNVKYDKYNLTDNSIVSLPPLYKEYSTGLFEYILANYKKVKSNRQNIQIDVCGLVTNICVINTVHQGLAMWHNIYKKNNEFLNVTCDFNLLEYLTVPLNIPAPLPFLFYPYDVNIQNLHNFKQISNLVYLCKHKFNIDIVSSCIEKNSNGIVTKKHEILNNYQLYCFDLYINEITKIQIYPYENAFDEYNKIHGGGKKHTKKCCCSQCKKVKTNKTTTKARKPRARSPSPAPKTSPRKRASSPVRKTNTPRKPKTVTHKK